MTTFEISIHALREEGDAPSGRNTPDTPNFYPRPPRGGRLEGAVHGIKTKDFYPRPPRGGRRVSGLVGASPTYFYPRPPRGGRQLARRLQGVQQGFLSTPSARRATKAAVVDIFQHRISIHALREEGDSVSWTIGRAEVKFLSTPSARRATHDKGLQRRVKEYFYPRPPRGGRRQDIFYDLQAEPFLSTPSARRATTEEVRPALFILFLSTPSARRATSDGRHTGSLHSDFYPRPPRGGRPGCAVNKSNQNKFLSTPSARRATANPDRGASTTSFLSTPSARRATEHQLLGEEPVEISIHALREEGDLNHSCQIMAYALFLSTPSARRATRLFDGLSEPFHISIHALREEGDLRMMALI